MILVFIANIYKQGNYNILVEFGYVLLDLYNNICDSSSFLIRSKALTDWNMKKIIGKRHGITDGIMKAKSVSFDYFTQKLINVLHYVHTIISHNYDDFIRSIQCETDIKYCKLLKLLHSIPHHHICVDDIKFSGIACVDIMKVVAVYKSDKKN